MLKSYIFVVSVVTDQGSQVLQFWNSLEILPFCCHRKCNICQGISGIVTVLMLPTMSKCQLTRMAKLGMENCGRV